ncbi:electron transport complex protein RnfC [Halanaerobium saccharolyticum]|uniref:Ion-translocating oxidoreductase complex subunit C n=1 Tax=Halanaerobium saccharolyticum TaxID=43595 RepID=A0A4R7Z605_9FIRM|nr:electron transport complex subunit RsxC [Halanaerobium saccharolyticum]RAK10489.1 electron transport complex protein RnfC [Halanaerobium saccharolyticum]TDW06754.1 electron transport complex protein RnfC [Halanaerobium saccharolyticum]TDX62389.1 electron transport complex protein RnfC [Halanaerobium saccharolyticum]
MSDEIKFSSMGGIEIPPREELNTDLQIEELPLPEVVYLPVKQHIGRPGKIIVNKGDYVKRGQCIVEEQEGVSARLHASVSGEILDIKEIPDGMGGKSEAIIIKRDQNSEFKRIDFSLKNKKEKSAEEIREIIKNSGIIGMGGAGFPTHIKLSPPADKPIDTIIINGSESEPYIAVDDRTMQEKTAKIFRGLELIKKAVGAENGFIVCEENKKNAIKKLAAESQNWPELNYQIVDSLYPHGAEKMLIEACLNREIPEGELPMEVGVIVNNVQTAVAVAEAVDEQQPVVDRIVSVSGYGIKNPKNLIVPLGTPIKELIDYCGGLVSKKSILIIGGTMTGFRAESTKIPVSKTGFGIIVLSEAEYKEYESRVCIRCAKCVDACPVYITPNRITDFINNDYLEEAEALSLASCIECGSCAYVCPAGRPLLRWLREGKARVRKRNN